MVKTLCNALATKADKSWKYDEYYVGVRDDEERKYEKGENHWSSAESLEWYSGCFLRDTMHGLGDYHWRYRGPQGTSVTYEGHFYSNCIHGYGSMSYPDGRVFTGLYHSNVRWGPGVESNANMRANVGLWRGTRLVRLAWRPTTNIIPDLTIRGTGKTFAESHRIILAATTKIIGEINSALDLIKQFGSNPLRAADKWLKLYPRYCTDQASKLCQVDVFEHKYYKGNIYSLKKTDTKFKMSENSDNDLEDTELYFVWNNSDSILHMMKHCYRHETQRTSEIDISSIISGPRKKYKPAAKHEIDCRTLLMASYLGDLTIVVQMINDFNIDPDIADNQGNTAIMYATFGDHCDLIHFVVEAGANVNNYNDSCCTALGLALLRFICIEKDVAPGDMLQSLFPSSIVSPRPAEHKILEWNMIRGKQNAIVGGSIPRTSSKINKNAAAKKIKSSQSLKEVTSTKKKTEVLLSKPTEFVSDESFSEDISIYQNISNEYASRVNNLLLVTSMVSPVPYIFEIKDLIKELDESGEDSKKGNEGVPRKLTSKVFKNGMKPSKDIMWQSSEGIEHTSVDSIEKQKTDMLSQVMSTILQLLSDGANPKLVKCPQSALLIATVAGSADLVRHLVHYGADVNEVCEETLDYTPLDVAISRQFTNESLELIRALLECGSNTNYRLRYGDADCNLQIPGPTLLHVVLVRRTENESEEEIRRQIIELLLEYGSDPMVQFKGCSAVDVAFSKNVDLLDTFIKSQKCKLNAIINDRNQTVLVKMLYLPFFKTSSVTDRPQILTDLLLFGADPLIECQDGEEKYPNVFVFAKKTLLELESSQINTQPVTSQGKSNVKNKLKEKEKKDERLSLGRIGVDEVGEFRHAIALLTECARLLYIRWLQAKLVIELIELIHRFRHRHWNIILKEHKDKKSTSLWLTPQRCLEIWDILKLKHRKMYQDKLILKHLLCIVQYYQIRFKLGYISRPVPTAHEKDLVDSKVSCLLQEHKTACMMSPAMFWKRPHVMPELAIKNDQKFKVCFECILPLHEGEIKCNRCNLVSFCSLNCMRLNIDRTNCHPCSEYLKNKYFRNHS
ncbi:ankyrin repeat and MYND domain-containing protein 1-like [Achroia grisella]|uniref:ankyrin repeat and MYND domain-containing protein 1-like n=1 Tax=Achroia grisella TaxID=688607 RepID=UPI0027D25714|nr:ankyrin repeat and MYND domain-containing protein 1-like [Achroia grisella]